ncbi:MAG TPA: cell envelope integrity protein CreD [Tahibacter sp.]|uniref:cell envelope integrity protein CreD n=1 Tax=Tahibacter sp. TaxID=2056211 RepID=UPI002B938B25|nr:cell envelope integrity protein CreD [Tahibacter sp.]HSX58569.1 cell envelope integrity protein CreD [Tahibacter sp.]
MVSTAHSFTIKVLGIGALALLMLIPLLQVQGLVSERNGLREQAVAQVASRWGEAQTVGGPMLALTYTQRWKTDQGWAERSATRLQLPATLDIDARLRTATRAYGIYETPVYTASLTMKARFEADDLAPLRSLVQQGAGGLELRLPLADVRGLREVRTVRINGNEHRLQPGTLTSGYATAVVAIDAQLLQAPVAIELALDIAGTERIQFLPFGRASSLKLGADWADPSFTGAFLPVRHDIVERKFDAAWQVLELNRGYGQQWDEGELDASRVAASAFGVTLYQPASVYQQNERAGKYGVLFIALTFVAFFLFEVLKKLRVHPVQYLLIGVALCTFYLLLLALSEQIGFGPAYALAAAAVALLVGGYAAAVLSTRRAGFVLGGSLALVYGLLYGLVVSEQYSLLIGALTLLAVVAVLMYLTRRVDWYGESRSAPAPSVPAP